MAAPSRASASLPRPRTGSTTSSGSRNGDGAIRWQAADHEYRQLLDIAPMLWIILDANGVVLDANTSCCRVLGTVRHRIVGLPFRTWVFDADRRTFLEHVRQCRLDCEFVESEARLQSREGHVVRSRLYTRRVRYKGQVVFPTVAVDLTEQTELEQARDTAERQRDRAERNSQIARAADAAKDRLIATVSHELRNPLNPALLAASGLVGWPGLPGAARDLAAIIKRNIELEARLVDDLLDVARVSRGQLAIHLRTLDVHRIIVEAVNGTAAQAAAAQVSIKMELAAEQHYISGDEARLRQVFGNLLNNAVKFSEPNGSVVLSTINDVEAGICVSVRDRGAGMELEVLETLFSPFERPRTPKAGRSGLGLGLTIAKGIVEAHGARIWASSDGPGHGSLFEIEFRTVGADEQEARGATLSPARESPPTEPPPPAPQKARIRVLVVEDQEDTGTLMSMFLTSQGFDVTCVQTMAEGLRQLEHGWDAVLTDIGLADGSGLEISRRARALGRPIKVFALSGYGSKADVAASLDAGCDQHLVKPVDLDRLVALLT